MPFNTIKGKLNSNHRDLLKNLTGAAAVASEPWYLTALFWGKRE